MILKEIHDMETYLAERCYCPGEIYSFDGFFYQIFKAEQECELLEESSKTFKNDQTEQEHTISKLAVAVKPWSKEPDKAKIQILYVMVVDGTIHDTLRMDATENNIKGIKGFITEQKKFEPDEYDPGSTAKSLKQILDLSNGLVIVD
jgi:hypothetical protein